MTLSDVNAAVRLISGAVAASPLRLYSRTAAGREEAKDNPLHRMLTLEPSEEGTAFTLIESFVSSILLTGNGYIEIARTAGGIQGLYRLSPYEVTAQRQNDGSIAYRVTQGSSVRVLPAANVIHVPWHSYDGVSGVSPITECRNTVGTALATERFGARFFRNNATPSGILMTKNKVKPDDRLKMREYWEALQTGSSQHRVAMLDQDLDYKPISLSNADSQWLESMRLSRERIAGIFGLHASQIGSESRVAGETYAAQSLDFLTRCLGIHFAKITAEFTRKVLAGRPDLEVEFDISNRLKLDFATMMQGYATSIQWGIMSPQEVRIALGKNPGPKSCEVFLTPANMMNQDRLFDTPELKNTGGSNVSTE